MKRIGGTIQLATNGEIQSAKGSFTYNLGVPMREPVAGADRMHGFTETPQPAYIEGVITDRGDLDVKALTGFKDGEITLGLANGKTVVLGGAYYCGSGNATTAEGEIEVKWSGDSAEERQAT